MLIKGGSTILAMPGVYDRYLDSLCGKDGGEISRTKEDFRYLLPKDRSDQYKVKRGEMIRACITSDFFLKEAGPWRDEAWTIIKQRPDEKFFLLTKRPQRVTSPMGEYARENPVKPRPYETLWAELVGDTLE